MYVSYGNGYSIYGSLTIIVIIMLWMYFCMYIILIVKPVLPGCTAGALTFIGRFINTVGVKRLTYIGCSLIISAWIVLYAGQYSYAGIIAGILLIDIGMQCIQLSNQTSAFALCPQASNRINTIFMTTYFQLAVPPGTFLAGTFWQWLRLDGSGGNGYLADKLLRCSSIYSLRSSGPSVFPQPGCLHIYAFRFFLKTVPSFPADSRCSGQKGASRP